MEDTYISFTTHEERVGNIEPMLSSVLTQWPENQVILSVAHDLKLPDFIKNSGIRVVRSADYGAFKKHSPLYINLNIKQYIVVDDDCIFPNGWFENLLKWSHRLPEHVVCGKGRFWKTTNILRYPCSRVVHAEHIIEPVPSHIYVGIGAALFKTDFFEDSVFPFPRDTFTYSDDIWFSAKLKDSVKISVVPYSREEYQETFGRPRLLRYAKEDNCLWKTARADNYKKWDAALHEYRDKLFLNKWQQV